MSTWTDELGQDRCDEINDLTYEQLRCGGGLMGSRHMFDEGMSEVKPSNTFVGMIAVKQQCSCGRWRRRTVHPKTHELLTVAYGGGMILTGPFSSADVFYAYLKITLERQRRTLQAVR